MNELNLYGAMRRFAALAGGVAWVAVAAGCAAVQAPPLPEGTLPAEFRGPMPEEAPEWPDYEWWTSFGSRELESLINRALEENIDLANNRRNLEAAQITLRDAGFNLWPTPTLSISTNTSYSRSRNDGVTTSNNSSGPFTLTGQASYNNIISKPVTYNRATVDYESRVAQAADLRLNTLGTVASTYFQVLMIRDRTRAAEQNLENAIEVGDIARVRLEVGMSVPIDVLQQQIAIERERTNLASLAQQERSSLASLAILMGQTMHDFDVEGQTLDLVSVPYVKPGLPSELLVRRPDLVQAEASVRSATLNVRAVRLNFFPQISLTGTDTVRSQSLTNLVSSPATSLTIGANLAQTLLDNGARKRNLAQARLSLETSLANYRRTVMQAFNEVELQLSNLELLEEQAAVARRNLEAAEESYRIALLRYEEGVADYQTTLTSMNTLFQTRTSLLDNKLQRLNAIVSLYNALGGGWSVDTEEAFQR